MKRITEILEERKGAVSLPCGGKGRCGKCKVKIIGGMASPPTNEERICLTQDELEQGVRLACQACADEDARIEILWEDGGMAQIVNLGIMPEIEINAPQGKTGAAVDVGTTTVSALLYDLETGKLLNSASCENPQRAYGADVISRIQASMVGEREGLKESINRAIVDLLQSFDVDSIDRLVITGNTAMLYLLTGRDASCLASAPFRPDTLFGREMTRCVYFPPCISGFIGADMTTAVLSSSLLERKTAMLMDIGTNGEMALYHRGKLYCCSTAAGPAFEGVSLSCGITARKGAIDKVWVDGGEMQFSTIDSGNPAGICGSGAIDALAALLELNMVDETGLLLEGEKFVFPGCSVTLTQADIREMQLAKAAIYAGAVSLTQAAGIALEEIEELIIAGGFGKHLNRESAVKIGLLPAQLKDKALSAGNSALMGASMLLLNSSYREKAENIAQTANVIDLSCSAFFMERYIDAMYF